MTDEEIVLLALDKAKDASIRKGASKEIGMHSLYKDSVDAMMSIKYHATKGLFPTPLFKNSSPNVEDKELKYIENNFKQTTLTVFVDYLSTITRPFGDGNWAIDYKEEENLYTKDNKTFKKYVEEELPIYKSLENFIKFILPSTKSIDANGFLSIRPFEIDYKRLEDGTEVVDDGELYRPTIFYFDSASVVDYEHKEYYLFLSQKKSKVKVAGKLEKTGLVFELYTRSGIYLIRQTGDKSKNIFEWELYYQNKTSEIPVVQLMGVPSRVEEESIFWSSPFSYATDLLDLALINANWLQASIKKCVYPHVVMFGSKCEFKDNDGSICQDGIINYGMPTQRTCSQCNGSGLKSRLSPLGTLLLQPTTTVTTGEEKTSQPPLQFVSPQVEVLKYIEENIYSHESKARTILKLRNKNSTVKTTGDVTATEIYDDSKSMTAFVKPISDQIFTIYEWALYFIGLQRYETSFKMPELSYPKTFDFKTPEDYLFDISEAIKNNLPPSFIQTILIQYINSFYGDSAKTVELFKTVIAADRLFGLSQNEINMKMAKGTIDKWEDILHSSVMIFVNDFVMNDEKWILKSTKDKVEDLKNKAKEVEQSITESSNSSIYNV